MAKLVAEEKARSADAAVHRTALGKLEAQQDELRVQALLTHQTTLQLS